jgi:hypothetical protein
VVMEVGSPGGRDRRISGVSWLGPVGRFEERDDRATYIRNESKGLAWD